MANEHAVPQAEEEKKHGDAIPPAEDGGHPRSVAAHLHDNKGIHDNKNAVQHHVPPGQAQTLREPPQEVSRVGKGHRGE